MGNKCVFCDFLKESQIIIESDNFRLVFDIDPIQEGHLLLISKKHYMNIIDIPNEVLCELIMLEKKIVFILKKFIDLKNVSIIQNNGYIMDEGTHFHVHIIPRYELDCFWDNQQVRQHRLDRNKVKKILRAINLKNE